MPVDGATDGRTHDAGMTLLDWYAGQALTAMVEAESKESHKQLTNGGCGSEPTYFTRGFTDDDYWDEAAKASYACASAMLAEKARREAVVQESSTTDHSPDAWKMEELQAANRELVDALEKVLNCIQETRGPNAYWVVRDARAILAKHKGVA